MRLLAGRTFEEARREGVREAMIDRGLMRRFFPEGNPLGATIPYGDHALTVVGVVEQARLYDVHQDGRPQIFTRTEDWGYRPLFYVMRTDREPQALLPEVRSAVRRVEPRVAVGDAQSLDEIVGNTLRPQRTSATLITAFALGALLLAAMGLFSVVAECVTRRRHELAVRLALGANHSRLLGLVLREGALLVGAGVLIAVPGIYAAGRLIRGVLVGVSPSDPLTLIAVAMGLLLVTMATCYVPARRALGIEPAQLLRHE
ncbi:MAG: FtsX-like permease family protein [Vicinamibacterales bacterium]